MIEKNNKLMKKKDLSGQKLLGERIDDVNKNLNQEIKMLKAQFEST